MNSKLPEHGIGRSMVVIKNPLMNAWEMLHGDNTALWVIHLKVNRFEFEAMTGKALPEHLIPVAAVVEG